MVVVYNKKTDKMAIFKEKTTLAECLGVSLRTIYNLKKKTRHETDVFVVYFDTIQPKKSRRGGGFSEKCISSRYKRAIK